MGASDPRRPAESAYFGNLNVRAHPVDDGDRRHALTVVQGAASGSALAALVESANVDAPTLDVNWAAGATPGSQVIARYRRGSTALFTVLANGSIVLNGETITALPGWLNATLGTNVTAGAGSVPGTQLERGRVFFRGRPAWAAQTFAAATVLLTVDEGHFPASPKSFSIRTSPDSNISSVLDLATNGQLTNRTGFGTSTTAYVPLDGLSYDLS
jgi:hypothetical protein